MDTPSSWEELDTPDMVPVRMVNEFVFCPRLSYLEWVQCEWEDNKYTEDGRSVHRRVDESSGSVPSPEEIEEFQARSIDLCAPELGVRGRIDMLEDENSTVVPIEFKRASVPDLPERAFEPDRVQLCAYALALRENGYRVEKGVIYFAESHRRIEILIDDALEQLTRQAIVDLRACAAARIMPAPLHHSSKCFGCSLNGICLPDEINFIHGETDKLRLLYAKRDDALPLYVKTQGAHLSISDHVLQVRAPRRGAEQGEIIQNVRLNEISQLLIYGNVSLTSAVIRELSDANIPIGFFSSGGWLSGRSEGLPHKNIELRRAQFRAAEDRDFCLKFARRIVSAKITNCRTMLRRNHTDVPREVLDGLQASLREARNAQSLDSLLGIEGNAARLYFSEFSGMLKQPNENKSYFHFEHRNRRPPKDPINALLSYTYGLLTKDLTLAVSFAGFDPLLGFYHQPRYGRCGLALDLMEEFRPLVADSVVLQCVNTGVVKPSDFIQNSFGVTLEKTARKKVIQTYERRMDQLIKHPIFQYSISYRRVLFVQARLLARFLLGEISEFPEFVTR